MNLLDFAVRRITGRIDLHNKLFKKAAQSQHAGHGQFSRKTRHSLQKIAKDQNSYFVEVHRNPQSTNDSLKVIPDSVFQAVNPKRMTNSRVKNTNVGARVNPTFDRSARW